MSTPTTAGDAGAGAAGVCAVCGAVLEPGAAFCGACGARVPAVSAPGAAASASAPTVGAVRREPSAPARAGESLRAEPPGPGRGAAAAPGWSLGADVDDAVAPVWRRLVALLVDQALAVLVGSAGLLAVLPALRSDGSVGALLVPGLLLLLLAAGQWFAEAFGGRTVGGALLGTRTVSARTGRAPGLWAVLVRSVVQALGVLLGGVGVYVVAGSGAWDEGPEQRGWHDKAAGTLVLRARAPRREDPAPDPVAP
ncbi:RDD family protein, partial [Cellulomonas sp. ACRRI]|uniref:RDD family protein n=1 Tax=Cellulomonas sp. ACRRI TaxID=2918188 RepID=UPI001EF326E7